jgi:hypothetical protein
VIARIAWLVARPTPGQLAVTALPVAAFAVATALVMIVLGGAQSFFAPTGQPEDLLYQALALIALTLLLVPLATLGGAAARLATRRRDDRLATLRLLGAPVRTVAAVTALEAGALALAGALVGWLLAALAAPAIGLIPFRGAPLGADALLHPGAAALVVAGVGALGVGSALLGLRRVVVSPLGVRMRQDAPRSGWIVALLALAGTAAALGVAGNVGGVPAAGIGVVLAGATGATLALLNLIGPWLVRTVARARVRRAATPARLLAARAVLESPKEAWRQVSGVAMATFTAVFAGTGVALLDLAGGDETGLVGDIRTGVVITVVGAFLTVACGVGVGQAALILDRRELNVSLHRLGVPFATMDAARRGAVVLPLVVTAVFSAACGVLVVLPLAGIALVANPLSVLVIVAALAIGVATVLAAIRLTRPLLRRTALAPA